MRLQRTTVTVSCHDRSATFILDPSQTRVAYFPANGSGPHVVYRCPGCHALHSAVVDLDTLDQLRDSGAPSDWPVIPDDLAGMQAAT